MSANGSSFKESAHLIGLVALVGRMAQDEVGARLAPLGVTYAQAVTLVRLWRSDDSSVLQRDLIESLGISRASGSEVLNQVEQLGFIERSWDPGDARNRVVALTPEGRELEGPVLAAFGAVEDALIGPEFGAARDDAFSLLRSMLGNARTIRGNGEES